MDSINFSHDYAHCTGEQYGTVCKLRDKCFRYALHLNTYFIPNGVFSYLLHEGDIVEILSYFTHPRDKVFARAEALVEFRKGEVVATRGTATYSIYNFLEDVEIIGNMHDINPELLKGGDE